MEEVKVNTSKTLTLTLGSDPDSNAVTFSLFHEFGDTIIDEVAATRVSAGVYRYVIGTDAGGEYLLSSAGKCQRLTLMLNGQLLTPNRWYWQTMMFEQSLRQRWRH